METGKGQAKPRTSLRRIGRNALHILGSQILGFGMALVASVVMARSLGPHDLGIFHQAMWFAGLVSVCLSLGLTTTLTRFTAQFRSEGRAAAASAALRLILKVELGIGVLSTAGLLALSSRIADYYFSPGEAGYFALAFLGLAPGLQTALYSAALEGAQIFRYQSLHAFTVTPLSLLAKILLLLWGYGLYGLLWCNLATALANLAFYAWAARREGLLAAGDSESDPWKKEVAGYHRSLLGIHCVDLMVWSRTENFFLGRYCPAVQIAYYNLALNLLQRLTGALPALMWKILLPLTTEMNGSAQRQRLARTYTHSLRYTALILFPLITLCYLAAYELVVIFYGHAYATAKSAFQILCLSGLLSALAQPGSAAIYATGRQAFILRYGAALAVVNLGLNFWWIPRHGAVGAAWSYTVTTSLGVLGGFVFLRLALNLTPPWKSWAKAAVACAAMGLVMGFLMRWNHPAFAVFSPLQDQIQALTGRRLEMFLGARTLRLAFASGLGLAAYAMVLALLARIQPEDRRIFRALEARLPFALKFPLPRPLRRKLFSPLGERAPGIR